MSVSNITYTIYHKNRISIFVPLVTTFTGFTLHHNLLSRLVYNFNQPHPTITLLKMKVNF